MQKILIKIPSGIQYISDWKDYTLPKGQCVVNKGITGCGYTEMCLTNSKNVVLCSPRKMLLENKRDQHVKDINILYLENEYNPSTSKVNYFDFVSEVRRKIITHIIFCTEKGLPVKFMITYDSSKYLIDYLKELKMLDNYYFIADEQQVIFTDSFLKSEVENEFLENISKCPNVIYLSATPMLDNYLDQIDEFKSLPYYKLDWSESGAIESVVIKRKRVSCLGTYLSKIIDDYRNSVFPICVDKNGVIYKSTEAVFYVNSIKEIISVIARKELKPEEVNILCSNTPENRAKIRQKLGKDYEIGKIPLEGQPHKMFTFCTSTVYVGADFYSTCASTYVFADPNLDCLALDISLDLPQIMGRQRLKENHFKNNVSIFYKTISNQNYEDRDQFNEVQSKRKEMTDTVLSLYQKGTDEERAAIIDRLRVYTQIKKYANDFVSISRVTGQPVYNKLIELAYERAWEVAQRDYQDSITVKSTLDSLDMVDDILEYKDQDDQTLDDFMNAFLSTNLFIHKMRLYCEFMDANKDNEYLTSIVDYRVSDSRYRNYYNLFGTSGCRAVGFQEARIVYMMNDLMKTDQLREAIVKKFPIKMRISKKKAKEELGEIYKSLGINATPKATEIEDYLELREVKIPEGGKRVNGYEIIALK